MMTKDDCMLLAGLAKICELDGETEIPRALLDLAARMSDSIGEEQMAVTLRRESVQRQANHRKSP